MTKVIDSLRRSLLSCCLTTSTKPSATTSSSSVTTTTTKSRRSSSLSDLFKVHQEPQEEDSLIDAAAFNHPPSPSRSLIVGTIYGNRRGHVSFCVQQDPSDPPPFLFELSMPTHLLAKEMRTGLLRIALECQRTIPSDHHLSAAGRRSMHSAAVWKAYCNGRKVGYAVKRRPSEKDRRILETVQSMSGGAGVLFRGEEEGELMYMRATYERVVGSRDSVSYHLINPGGSPAQELSVFLLRTG